MMFRSGLFIDRIETRGNRETLGGHNRKLDYLREPKIRCRLDHATGVSQRKLAREREISARSVRRVLAKHRIMSSSQSDKVPKLFKNGISKIEVVDQVMVNRRIFKNHDSRQNLVIWPDKTTAHYARSGTDWLESENLLYIPKDKNPPNCLKYV